MTNQKSPVESLREEWQSSDLCMEIARGVTENKKCALEVQDWWLEKFSTHHDQLLAEILEEVGDENEKAKFESPNIEVFIQIGVNRERSRIRDIIKSKIKR